MPNTQPAQQPVIPSGGGLERVYALLPAQRPAPLIPVYLAAALIACQVVMWQVLACNILFTVQYPINALSESQAKAMEQIQQYYPALVTGLGIMFITGMHMFLLLKYLQGHRWAALVLTVLELLGMLCALSMVLIVGVLMSQLNGASSEQVDYLLGSSSPLYLPVYAGMPYLVMSVIALALLWSRASRAYTDARSAWRLRHRLRELEEQCDLLMQAQSAQAEIAKDT